MEGETPSILGELAIEDRRWETVGSPLPPLALTSLYSLKKLIVLVMWTNPEPHDVAFI